VTDLYVCLDMLLTRMLIYENDLVLVLLTSILTVLGICVQASCWLKMYILLLLLSQCGVKIADGDFCQFMWLPYWHLVIVLAALTPPCIQSSLAYHFQT